MKVGLVYDNGSAQGSVKLGKAYSPITSHAYTLQLLSGIKSEQKVETKQLVIHNQNFNTDRTPVAHVELDKSYPRAPMGSFTNSEHVHFLPLPRVTKQSAHKRLQAAHVLSAILLIPSTLQQFWVVPFSCGALGVGWCWLISQTIARYITHHITLIKSCQGFPPYNEQSFTDPSEMIGTVAERA